MSELANRIEDAARAVTGVTHVYAATAGVLAAIGIGDAQEVTVSVGVDSSVPGHATATAVAAAIHALVPDAQVVVRIGRVTRS